MELTTNTSDVKEAIGVSKATEETTGDDIMTTGLTTDTAAVLALLADTSRAGNRYGGFGGGEGGGYYGSPFATQGSNAVRLNRNEGTIRDAHKCTQDTLSANLTRISDQAEESRRNDQFTSILDAMSNMEFRTLDRLNGLKDNSFQSELRLTDKLSNMEREAAANARVADQKANDALMCCKETQCLVQKENAESRLNLANTESRLAQRMESIETGRVRDENAKLQARVNQLEIFSTCGCGCGGGVNPCPPTK